jgi:hypothetical protein
MTGFGYGVRERQQLYTV